MSALVIRPGHVIATTRRLPRPGRPETPAGWSCSEPDAGHTRALWTWLSPSRATTAAVAISLGGLASPVSIQTIETYWGDAREIESAALAVAHLMSHLRAVAVWEAHHA